MTTLLLLAIIALATTNIVQKRDFDTKLAHMQKTHQGNLDIEIATLPIVSRAETFIALTSEKRFEPFFGKEKLEIEMVTTIYKLSEISDEIASNQRLQTEGSSSPASLLAARLIYLLGFSSTDEFMNEYLSLIHI